MKNPLFWATLFVAVVFLTLVSSISLGSVSADVDAGPANLLENGSFEAGSYAAANLPDGWQHEAWQPGAEFLWQDGTAYLGEKSIQITAAVPNDARWHQTAAVEPHTNYLLSAWIKTEDVAHTAEVDDAGANLSLGIAGSWMHTDGLIGTHDWTYTSLVINSGDANELTVHARLGYWGGTTSGTAWFDQLKLMELDSSGPIPNWKILTLIYKDTDFTYVDGADVEHHVITTLTNAEIQQAAGRAQQFVEEDIPALTSGVMVPELTIRFPTRTITELSTFGSDGWWLSPANIAPERDPAFDAVLAIWNPNGIEINSGVNEDLSRGKYAGLTPGMGRRQTYALIVSNAATTDPQRNVFKHEFGHSILSFFDFVGTAAKPTVSNHAGPTDYVNCISGEYYVWVDETDDNPIPNSIYHNESGFTHDYYSGTTATADQPSRCLGISPAAWATGGPVSRPIVHGFEMDVDAAVQNGKPGTIVSFELQVTNTGSASDSYQLSYAGSLWPVNGPTKIGPLAADNVMAVPITVTIPSDANGLEEDEVTLMVTSLADDGLYEMKTLKTRANVVRGVALSPGDAEAIGIPGVTVTYTLAVKNSGNVSDTFSLSVSDTKWPLDFPTTVGPLAPRQSQEIQAVVTIDQEAGQGEKETAVITVISQSDPNISTSGRLKTSTAWLLDFLPVVSKP